MKGIVTDIQRFSVHDGPGIRTTVFLKGCQMRCRWCHNPEALSPQPQLQLFLDKCIACGACLRSCPHGAHTFDQVRREFHRELCQSCGACSRSCHAQALVLVGREMSSQEVVAEVEQDRDFYANSSGGVTLSGGEPLLQAPFAHEILALCREAFIHTAIETNLAWPWPRVQEMLDVTDMVMADIKVMDSAVHRQWTGVGNEDILANVLRLGRSGKPFIIRTPIIPGLNDSPEEVGAIADYLAGFSRLLYYELLPYHPLAAGKYQSLGLEYATADLQRPDAARMKMLRDAAAKRGIAVRAAGMLNEKPSQSP